MNNPVTVPVRAEEDAPLPAYAREDDAGADVRAAEEAILAPGGRALVRTGLRAAIPPGYFIQVCPRSGFAAKYGVTVLNAPGVIDASYRGEIGVILVNHGKEPFAVRRGDRIAQLVLLRAERIAWNPVTDLPSTDRGDGGFGSTGR